MVVEFLYVIVIIISQFKARLPLQSGYVGFRTGFFLVYVDIEHC